MELTTIINIVLAIMSTVFGVFWLLVKKKLKDVVNLGGEAFDLIKASVDIVEDNKVTDQEVKLWKEKAQDVAYAWEKLFPGKKKS